jgi:hypothetical protein
MTVRSRNWTLLRQVVVLLLAVAFLLAPYHVHVSVSSFDGLVVNNQISQVHHTVGDGAPGNPDDGCPSCLLMKQVQAPSISDVLFLVPLLDSNGRWPVYNAVVARSMIFGVFRPPIFIAA